MECVRKSHNVILQNFVALIFIRIKPTNPHSYIHAYNIGKFYGISHLITQKSLSIGSSRLVNLDDIWLGLIPLHLQSLLATKTEYNTKRDYYFKRNFLTTHFMGFVYLYSFFRVAVVVVCGSVDVVSAAVGVIHFSKSKLALKCLFLFCNYFI